MGSRKSQELRAMPLFACIMFGLVDFAEVHARAGSHTEFAKQEDAVTLEKRRHLFHMARRFLVERRLEQVSCRFDVLAIESPPGQRPVVRLHKGAFTGYNYS